MKKTLTALLCLLGTGLLSAAFGATRQAIFNGFANRLTESDFTATLNDNTLNDDGSVTIVGTSPITLTYIGTTYSSTWWGTSGISILLKYSSLPTTGENAALMTTSLNSTSDSVGCYVTSDGNIGGVYTSAVYSDGGTGATAIDSSGYLVLTYLRSGGGTIVYDGNGTAVYTSSGLQAQGTVGATVNIGGLSSGSLPATGLKIDGVAVYYGRLTADEITTAVSDYETFVANDKAVTVDATSTSVSAINTLLDGATYATVTLPSSVTIEYDEAFDAEDVTLSVPSGGAVTFTAVSGVTPSTDEITLSMTDTATLTIDTANNSAFELASLTLSGSGALTLNSSTATFGSIISSGPTITASALTVKTTLTAALQIPESGSLTITVPDGSTVTQSGVISDYSSDVAGQLIKAGAGTLTVSSANTFTGGLTVSEGTMKTTASKGYGPYTSGAALASLSQITVGSGATLDLANTADYCYNITLAGGTLTNTGTSFETGNRQTTQLTLTADSTVGGTGNFGLLGSGFTTTYLNLDGHTLTKTGSNTFYLYNTTGSGDGTIQVDEGTLTFYSTCSLSGTTVSLGDNGTLLFNNTSTTGVAVDGTGTVNIGTLRSLSTLATFADDSALTLSITLSSSETASSTLTIPYSGAAPNNVIVYLPDGSVDSTATCTSVDGTITISTAAVPSLTYPNPVTDAEVAFTYEFTNAANDNQWTTTANWYPVVNNRYVPISGSYAPAMTSSNMWDPCVFSNKTSVTSSATLEGWNMKFALFDNSDVTIAVGKLQCGTAGNAYFWVDATSKLTISSIGSNTTSGTTQFFIAAPDGLEFTQNFAKSPTFQYYLKGDGSVKYAGTVTAGTHNITAVVLDAYTSQPDGENLPYGLVKNHPLVTFATSDSTATFGTSSASVYFNNSYTSGTTGTASTDALTRSDGTQANLGKYYIHQETDGVYIDFIGYSADAATRGFTISIQ